MRLLIASIVILFASAIHFAQEPVRASLYALKCKSGVSLCGAQEIVRYDFQNGELKLRTVVFTSQTDDIRFDVGRNPIVNGNILLNNWGDVIDLRTGNVLYKQDGELVAVIGSMVIIDHDNEKDDDIYTFDLRTHAARRIKTRKDIEDLDQITSQISPGGKLIAKWKGDGFRKSVFEFSTLNKFLSTKKIRSVRGDFRGTCSSRCSDMSRAPFAWINDSKIITQRKNGDLVTVDITGRIRPVVKIKIEDEPDSMPRFWRDHDGNIFYRCGGMSYLIDVKNRKFSTERLPLGNGFSENNSDTFSTDYFYKGNSIGTVWSVGALTTKNYLAVLYAKDGKNLGYPDGFKVWSSLTKKWITINDSPFLHLIDWGE